MGTIATLSILKGHPKLKIDLKTGQQQTHHGNRSVQKGQVNKISASCPINGADRSTDQALKPINDLDKTAKADKLPVKTEEKFDGGMTISTTKNVAHITKKDVALNVCHICGRAYDEEAQMLEHITEEHFQDESYEFKCEKCHRRFRTRYHLKRHGLTHNPAAFICSQCSACFRSDDSLKVHLSRIHGIGEDGKTITTLNFDCTRCSKAFGTQIELRRHREWCLNSEKIKKHRKEKANPGLVDSGGVSPSSSGSYLANARNGSKLSKECPVCNRKFTQQANMVRHFRRLHKKEAMPLNLRKFELVGSADTQHLPYVCTECDKRFTRSASLNMHKKRHIDIKDRPYECNFCGKKYIMACELRKHSRRSHHVYAVGGDESGNEDEEVIEFDEPLKQGDIVDVEVGTC